MNLLKKHNIHIVGTGTIGLPLAGLFSRYKDKFNVGEVTFHKNTPWSHDINNVKQLLKAGAKLSTDKSKFKEFEKLGVTPSYTRVEAIERADVIIDCTPSGTAINHKGKYYNPRKGSRLFVAQGSEKGFGKIFAHGVNNEALDETDQFLQVASCNTHAGASIMKTLAGLGELSEADFVYIRRSNDISQDSGITPSVEVGNHPEMTFGTHHAIDIHDIFRTVDKHYKVYSSACKVNSQLMHTMRYDITIHTNKMLTPAKIQEAFHGNKRIALTKHKTANKVFSHGREFGYYGRILNQVVIPENTISVERVVNDIITDGHVMIGTEKYYNTYRIRGFAFTPQDGNSLISSVSAALWHMNDRDWDKVDEQLHHLDEFLFEMV